MSVLQNADMFWKPTIAVQADVGTFIKDLSAALDDFSVDGDWVAKLAARDQAKEEANAEVGSSLKKKQHSIFLTRKEKSRNKLKSSWRNISKFLKFHLQAKFYDKNIMINMFLAKI